MRYAIFSDIHGNQEAFSAVLDFYKKSQIDQYIFLGDIVGYGANPNETMALLKTINAIIIAGNHDWAAAGSFDLEAFTDLAKTALLWTKNVLSRENKVYLSQLPLFYQNNEFTCAHGSLKQPGQFNYLIDKYAAGENFNLMQTKLLFVGHSHKAECFLFTAQQQIVQLHDETISLKENTKYIINTGSVGQPRDNNNKACACIYDSSQNIILFNRIAYDITTAANKIIAAGLPEKLAQRLYLGA
jgi:predicted phosphodiesterase